jgi:hypothetical protein
MNGVMLGPTTSNIHAPLWSTINMETISFSNLQPLYVKMEEC